MDFVLTRMLFERLLWERISRMVRAHKIRLNPTEEQNIYFAKAAGTARFVWNWALAEWNRQYEAGERPTALSLKKQFNEIRREQFPWTWEVTKTPPISPFWIWVKPLRRSLKEPGAGNERGVPSTRARRE